ncbi:MAG TPA: metal-dependent transcriptional regulator [Candidatus Acidoferrales bacterium]|nr:metal-dependent transcriptional regulator [Candidatus Acidoferrales bacterium]
MQRQRTSVSQEDYLKAIWNIVEEEQTPPISARLAEDLQVTPPAVAAALKRMARDGQLRVRRDGTIQLTSRGRARAEHLALRHRLAEKLLTDVIGLDWSRAHEEAERLEHGISDDVMTLLLERFGRDSSCPHGVPVIGGLQLLRNRRGAFPLAQAEPGDSVEILRVQERDPQFLTFVAGLGLRPGSRLRVRHREYDETMTLETPARSGRPIHLGKPATSRIWVRRVSA